MFDNIGGKIKTLATVVTIIGIVASVIAGLYFMIEEEFGLGLVIIIVGALSSWIGSFLLYGYGELIEKTAEIAQNTRRSGIATTSASVPMSIPPRTNTTTSQTKKKTCPSCLREVSPYDSACRFCGQKLN